MTIAHYPQRARPAPVLAGPCCVLVLITCFASACSSSPASREGGAAPRYGEPTAYSARSNEVLFRAIGLVGTPYSYGGNTQAGGFDCSGLIDFVFMDAAGLRLPRSTRELIQLDARAVARSRLQPGDLVFFNPGGGPATHIGIYVGEGRFVHAPSSGGTVRLDFLDSDYWNRAYFGAKRVL